MSETQEHHKMMDEVLEQHLDKFVVENTKKNIIGINKKNMRNTLTQEQKIDFIFNYIKAKKRNGVIKTILKLIILGLIIYILFAGVSSKDTLNSTYKDKIMPVITKQLGEIVAPLVKEISGSMTQDLTKSSGLQTIDMSGLSDGQIKIIERILNNK